ncbi:MAG: Uncharacterised protein [SAR116 cluster bacterium]|nr:MAG: Uncharacterised protein [SAR116 cluster bacterium]
MSGIKTGSSRVKAFRKSTLIEPISGSCCHKGSEDCSRLAPSFWLRMHFISVIAASTIGFSVNEPLGYTSDSDTRPKRTPSRDGKEVSVARLLTKLVWIIEERGTVV